MGHIPSWDVNLSKEVQQAIREACPGVIINHTTGVSGPNYQGALDCVRETAPEMAACNAGSLNYLKVKADGTWDSISVRLTRQSGWIDWRVEDWGPAIMVGN